MKTAKITIEPKTSFITPLQSDTLFGQFCWQYRYIYGESELEELLKDYDDNPAIVFSDGFPEGFLPVPRVPYLRESGDVESYKKFKQFKKFLYVKKEILFRAKDSGYLFEFFSQLPEREIPQYFLGSPWVRSSYYRVSIDRNTGTAREGMLFELPEYFIKHRDEKGNEPFRIDIFLKYDDERVSLDRIKEVFKAMGILGFGAKAGWGKGKFELSSVEEFDLKGSESSLTFVSLSTGLPKKEEIKDFYAEFFTKYPKHPNDIGDPAVFKAPVVLTRSGSVFKAVDRQEVYGVTFKLSKPDLGNFIHSAKILPFFLEFEPW
ncbi:MAG: RAMP superfamily CRISPR-associated protein [Desulfurobacteriaceae bacterium]